MDREKLDGWCERGIIALVLAILVFGPLATGAVRTLEFLIVQGLTVAAMTLWMLRLWIKPRPQLLMPPFGWGVLAFLVYAVVRYFMADIEYVARLELIRVVVYAALFFIVMNNLHRQETVSLIGFTMLFLAMGIALYGGYQFFSGDNRVWHFQNSYTQRATGTYINPNHFAGFLEMLLPLGIAYTIVGRMKPALRILLGYSSVVIVAGIGISLSRGGWIATGLSLILFFLILLFHRGFRLPAAVALLVIGLGVACFAPRSSAIQQRAEITAKELRSTEYTRYRLWLPALELWKESPWLGIGPGHFDTRFTSVRPQEIQAKPDRTHNDYLNTLVDWGIVGLVLVLGALAVIAFGVVKAWRHVGGLAPDLGNRRSNRFAFVLGASFGLVALLFHSATDFNMHIPANAILAVTLLALLASHQRFATDRWWTNAGRPLVLLVTLVLLAGIAVLSATGVRRAKAYVWSERAAKQPNFSPAKIAVLEHVFAAEPKDFQTAYDIGECFRIPSFEGGDNYAELGQKAVTWFERAEQLNRFHAGSYLRHGMCLDWLEQHDEAWEYFSRAEELDPNGFYTVAHVGWHFVQVGDYAAARPWFERSTRLEWKQNQIAYNYLALCDRRLTEAANDDLAARLRAAPKNP